MKKRTRKRAFSILTLLFLLVQTILTPVTQYVNADSTTSNFSSSLEEATMTAASTDIDEKAAEETIEEQGEGFEDGTVASEEEKDALEKSDEESEAEQPTDQATDQSKEEKDTPEESNGESEAEQPTDQATDQSKEEKDTPEESNGVSEAEQASGQADEDQSKEEKVTAEKASTEENESEIATLAEERASYNVDHIDIACKDLKATVYVNGTEQDVTFSFDKSDFGNTVDVEIIDSNGKKYAYTVNEKSSTDNQGNTQVRLDGNFPIGTYTNPITYTVNLTKTVTVPVGDQQVEVNITLSVNDMGYWSSLNVCPPLKDNKDWADGDFVKGSGIDLILSSGSTSVGSLNLAKSVDGVNTNKDYTFTLYKKVSDTENEVIGTYKLGNGDSILVCPLDFGTYYVVESLENVEIEGYEWEVTGDGVDKAVTLTSSHSSDYIHVKNIYTPETTEVSGKKTWNDKDNQDGVRPKSITVNLLANGTEVAEKTVTAEDNWAYSFTDLDKYKDGQLITYTVTEDAVADYSTTIAGYDITNTHTPGQTSVTVTKVWKDAENQDGIRPNSIKVQLKADGQAEGEAIVLNEANSWTYTWTDLDQKASGKDIVYTVEEDGVPKGYTTEVEGNATTGYTITNSYTPETVDISGTKTWDDKDNQDGVRPKSITVNLLANGTEVAEKTVTAEDNWAYSFTELDMYKNGQQITYTVTEDAVADYSTIIDGYDITNTHTPGQTSVTVTKAWDDKDNQDGIRPESIKVQLKADGQAEGEAIVLNEANSWTYTWTDLDQKASGKDIVYTVEEDGVPKGYTTEVEGNATTGYTITNSYTPETVDISGTKTWDDKDNQDGVRPKSITVNLLANGTEVAEKTVTAEDNWAYSFTELDMYKNGQQITYTVTEDAVADYSTIIDGYDITNTHTPGQTSVTVTKAWDDKDNQDGIRPESIKVQLKADGQAEGEA
ncbi:Cna B-type domain-containing protein, partial [Bacillus sp. D386]|uniref:Cna B-type domain-containing protein n=1 Tax=Bacillus sp. D386 TaxID=2587155 RepID=UPI0015D5DE65